MVIVTVIAAAAGYLVNHGVNEWNYRRRQEETELGWKIKYVQDLASLLAAIVAENVAQSMGEPTAALDPLAEYEIYTHLDEIVEDRTTIIALNIFIRRV